MSLLVKDSRGENRYQAGDFPITLGGEQAQVAVPGWGRREPAAFVGREGAGYFLQPGPLPFPLLRNGEALEGSAALAHGDKLRIGRAELVFYHPAGSGQATLVVTGGAAAPSDDGAGPIAPVNLGEHKPAAPAPVKTAGGGFSLAWILLVLVLAAAAVAALFVFSARTVTVTFAPAPDHFEISGPWPRLTLGESRLLRPGTYTMTAGKTGYHDLSQPFTVGKEERQTFPFTLRKLPGKLTVRAVSVDGGGALTGGVARVDGQPGGPLPLAGHTLEPGSHAIAVEIPEYLPASTNVVIRGLGEAQETQLALTPAWSMVGLVTDPPGAAVTVDGKPAGRTPARLRLMQGTRAVEVKLPLHVAFSTQVVVRAHSPFDLAPVRLVKSPGKLRISSDPTGSNLTTSFLYSGVTPAEIEVTADVDHRVTVSRTGYEPATVNLRVGPEQVETATLTLKPLVGKVTFAVTPADAEIRINGTRLPAGTKELELRAERVEIVASKEGFEPVRKTLTPRPGFTLEFAADLKPVAPPAPPEPPKNPVSAEAGALRRVEPRDYAAGSPRNEQGRRSNETLRAMRMTRAFQIGEREITNAQFRRFKPAHGSGEVSGRALKGDDQPAVNLSWQDAAAYCNWLSAQEGLPPAYVDKGGKLVQAEPMTTGYRLPSEAEWEYAARLKDGKPVLRYPWGLDMPPAPKSGNYADASAKPVVTTVLENYQDGHAVTAPPGSYPANELGLFDLGGNVAEWMHDVYDIAPVLEEKTYTDYLGPTAGDLHVIKGASWRHATLARLRLAYRDYGEEPRNDLGFRVARYAE